MVQRPQRNQSKQQKQFLFPGDRDLNYMKIKLKKKILIKI